MIKEDYETGNLENVIHYSSDSDTYIRKIVYLATGRLYHDNKALQEPIIDALGLLLTNTDEKIRQTAVYTLGEIGKTDAPEITGLQQALLDKHHSVVNAVIGAL